MHDTAFVEEHDLCDDQSPGHILACTSPLHDDYVDMAIDIIEYEEAASMFFALYGMIPTMQEMRRLQHDN